MTDANDPLPGDGSTERGSGVELRIESVDDGKLRGWLVDHDAIERPVRFALIVGGEEVGRFVADQPRSDVAARVGGDGRHGFGITIDSAWAMPRPRSVRFELEGGQRIGPNRKLVIDLARPDLEKSGTANSSPPSKLPDGATAESERELARLVSALRKFQAGDLRLASEIRERLERSILRPVARRAFAEKRWADLARLADLVRPSADIGSAIHLMVARGLLYEGKPQAACAIFQAGTLDNRNNAAWLFYHGVSLTKLDRHGDALPLLRRAVELDGSNGQYHREFGQALVRFARSSEQRPEARREMLEQGLAELDDAVRLLRDAPISAQLSAAQILIDLGRFREALARVDEVIAREPESRSALLARSRALIALGDIDGALAASRRVLEVDPANQAAQYQVRTLAAVGGGEAEAAPVLAAAMTPEQLAEGAAAVLAMLEGDVDPAAWLAISASPFGERELAERLEGAPAWAGRIVSHDPAGGRIVFWRLELLRGLRRSGVIDEASPVSEALEAIGGLVATWRSAATRTAPPPPALPPRTGTAICMSRYGARMFGGGEHFLSSMADHYEAAGYTPVIVAAQPGQAAESGMLPSGRRWEAISGEVDQLRAFFLAERPALVHVLSGLGFEVAHALQYLDIPFVYGVHFWRDCLGATEGTDLYFTDFDKGPIARRLFDLVIERAAAIYSNSNYTQAVLEEAFRVRTPILYSLPRDDWPEDDRAAALALTGGRADYVLLLNARIDKGYGLIVETAARVPQVPFVVVASQSDREAAVRYAAQRGLSNLHVIGRTDRPDLLYRHALAAAVPSYQFVETFSRVCIEAQRFGTPVIGSDKGNVPYLLRESGTVLPEDPDLWAAEIARLAEEPAYRTARRRLAAENSERYAYSGQANALTRLMPKLQRRILVAIGSGIGNMLHVGPMIRAISRHFGQPVDLVIAEDHAESLFLLHDPAVVSEVFALGRAVLRRKYDIVLVTHSFGAMRPPFAGRQVFWSRDWQRFEPEGPLHETIHNLECARVLLGAPYGIEDTEHPYIAEIAYTPPVGGRLVGFHGGSKDGFWSAKRWPGHAELAQRLKARGWQCASYGTPSEFVEGTIDRTGGTIAQMADSMRDCAYFITNDSGVMNIANALGIPLTALFAPTNPATRAPLRSTSTAIQVAKSCSPCEVTPAGRELFYSGRCACIAEIGVDQVEAHVVAHMAELGIAPGRSG